MGRMPRGSAGGSRVTRRSWNAPGSKISRLKPTRVYKAAQAKDLSCSIGPDADRVAAARQMVSSQVHSSGHENQPLSEGSGDACASRPQVTGSGDYRPEGTLWSLLATTALRDGLIFVDGWEVGNYFRISETRGMRGISRKAEVFKH
jgi:hypothetical protein